MRRLTAIPLLLLVCSCGPDVLEEWHPVARNRRWQGRFSGDVAVRSSCRDTTRERVSVRLRPSPDAYLGVLVDGLACQITGYLDDDRRLNGAENCADGDTERRTGFYFEHLDASKLSVYVNQNIYAAGEFVCWETWDGVLNRD